MITGANQIESAGQRLSLYGRMKAQVVAQWAMLENGGFATMASLSSAVLGFAFWSICTRHLSAETVGLASAVISAMTLVAMIAELGLSTLLMGHVAREGRVRHELISGSVLLGVASATCAAAVGLYLINIFSLEIGTVLTGSWPSVLFAIGVAVTVAALILDGALFGLLKTAIHMYRELAFAVCRIVLILFVVYYSAAAAGTAVSVLTVWVASGALALAFVVLCLRAHKISVGKPNLPEVIGLLPVSLQHHGVNLAATYSSVAMPLLVAEVVSPQTNAVFFLAWMIVNVSLLGCDSLATAVYAIDKYDVAGRVSRLRFALFTSLAVSATAAVLYYLLLNEILGVMNPSYRDIAGSSLSYLGFGMMAWNIKALFLAVMRVEGRMREAAIIFAIGGAAQLVGAATMGTLFGLQGIVIAVLAVLYINALIMLPYVLKAADLWFRLPEAASRAAH